MTTTTQPRQISRTRPRPGEAWALESPDGATLARFKCEVAGGAGSFTVTYFVEGLWKRTQHIPRWAAQQVYADLLALGYTRW